MRVPGASIWRRLFPSGEEEAASRYRDLVENSLGLICTHTLEGTLLSINPAGAELLGYPPAEVIGRSLRDFLAPAVRASMDEYLKRLIERTLDSGFMRVQTRQGEERILYYRNRVCRSPDGGAYALGHAQDLTDLKRTERSLRRTETELLASHARRAAVVDAALDGILSFDEEGRVLELNPAALALLGRSPEEAAGVRLVDVVELPGFVPEEDGGLTGYLRRGSVVGRRVETRGFRADGSGFPLELAITRLPGEGPAAFTAFLRDLTDLREVERLKAQFVATVSHELRTPLTSLRGALGLLAGGVLGALPAEAFNAVRIAERSIQRLVGLVNDILDIERLENGRLSLQLGRHPLADLLARSIEEVEALAADAGIRLEAEPTAAGVRGDGERLVQVVVNLLSNALKFSPRGSVVRLRVRVEPEWVEVQVEDQGRGVPPAHQSAIFERFRQVELSDAAGQRGAGLGLAIAKSIVELHGGTIGVKSARGGGSTFWFRVPHDVTADRAM